MSTEVIKVAKPQIGEEEAAAVREVLLSGRLISGPRVAEFEKLFAEYVGSAHAVAVNSGTAALHVALACCGIGPGDEVVVPALTFFSTVTAVMHQNAVPIFADISLDNFSLDPGDFSRRITPRTKAVIPVHYFGHAAEMDELRRTAVEHDIIVIEDCAQAHGTRYRGDRVGSIGDFGAFSFFATKHMTTGEGGAITTDNEEWAVRAKKIRSHGMEGRDDHVLLGYNYRMTEMAGAMGVVQMGRLEELNRARRRNSQKIIERLGGLPWAQLPKIPEHVEHTFFWLHLLIDEDALGFTTQELIARLRERGIEVRNRYSEPLNRQPVLSGEGPYPNRCPTGCPHYGPAPDYGAQSFPNAERAAGRVIGLPNRPDMTPDELDRVVDVVTGIQQPQAGS